MVYRGEDLDLRTPQTWSATTQDLAAATDAASPGNGGRGSYGGGPIWIDETLLACCNHAFDIALAHRSGDVRVEHLLHALTRIESSAEALEMRGVRVAALRRESATIIAAEIPVGLPNGRGAPRRSDEFAEVLRLAAAHAARRGDPAGVDDLLFVLLDQRPEVPGVGLLVRHAPRLLPPRETYDPSARYDNRYAPAPYERQFRIEPPRHYRSEPVKNSTDVIQNSRIEALEQLVRTLSADLATERQAVAALLKDLNRSANAQRDDQDRLQADLFDRLHSIEQVVTHAQGSGIGEAFGERLAGFESSLERRVQDLSHSFSEFAARMVGLENAVRGMLVVNDDGAGASRLPLDLSPIAHRLDMIEEAVLNREPASAISPESLQSLQAVVARIEAATENIGRSEGSETVVKLSALSSAVDGQMQEFGAVGERLSAVERAVSGEIETATAKHEAYARDLTELHDALLKLNQNQHTLAGSIDQWRTDAAGDIAMISNRLANLDRDNERPIETLNALSAHMDTMNRMFIERYHRRNRFWFWLFGTDDWLGRSWPSQTAAINADAELTKAP